MNSLSQRRIARAFEHVDGIKARGSKKEKEDYARYLRRLPAFIQANGLLGMAVFHASKGDAHEKIMEWVFEWLSESGRGPQLAGEREDRAAQDGSSQRKTSKFDIIIREYTSLSPSELSAATEEAILFASQLKRLAEAMLK